MDDERSKRLAELQKQRAELDKLISELAVEASESPVQIKTNIPYPPQFIQKYASRRPSHLGVTPPSDLLEMKIFVNKKGNQISSDYAHTIALINEMRPLSKNLVFQELFIHKLIELGRVQVSAHLDSYKPLCFILKEIAPMEMVHDYVNLMITRKGIVQELRGIYAIYFGFLNISENVADCWLWMASVLNTPPSEETGYIFEVFLKICGEMLCEKCPKFCKIVKYVEKFFLKEIFSEPVRIRIGILVDEFKKRLILS